MNDGGFLFFHVDLPVTCFLHGIGDKREGDGA